MGEPLLIEHAHLKQPFVKNKVLKGPYKALKALKALKGPYKALWRKQVAANEYLDAQGISSHVEDSNCAGVLARIRPLKALRGP